MGMAWVDEAARGRGLSGMMIAAAADLNGGSPIQDHRGLGFSEAGFAAHASAHRKLREWALDQGYDVVEIDDWDGLGL